MKISDAIVAWQSVLGIGRVIITPYDRFAAEAGTFKSHVQIPAILKPKTRAEVQACVRIANQHRTPLYPTSSGHNWGYGSRMPTADACTLLDLSGLNRIVAVDPQMATITLEAGVSFFQLIKYLDDNELDLLPNLTGAAPFGSPIGNALERGYGIYGDAWENVIQIGVVLANGHYIETGHGPYENAQTDSLDRWGLGPDSIGLFAQSNFGIVTQATLALRPRPLRSQSVAFQTEDDDRLSEILGRVQNLILRDMPNLRFGLWNDHRTLATRQAYPWEDSPNGEPLQGDLLATLKKKWNISRWNGTLTLMPYSEEQAEWQEKTLRREIEPLADVFTVNDSDYFNNLQTAYWRKRKPPRRYDLDREGVGFLWHTSSVPFRADDLMKISDLLSREMLRHGFDPNLSILSGSARTLYVGASIIFDREAAGADEAALACNDALLEATVGAGYYPHRLNGHTMHHPLPLDSDYLAFLRRLKQTLDPNHILAPNRYLSVW